jgi:hypothetical protein
MRRLLVSLVAVSLAIAACQGQPATLLTDPKAILSAAAASTSSATSVHVDLSADGAVEFDPLGTGAGAAVNLRGTTMAADIDLAGNRLHSTFASPNLMNIAGEIIAIDQTVYLKSSLTGAKYITTSAPSGSPPSPGASASAGASAGALAFVTELLARPDLKPVKGDDVPCAGGTCYTVTLSLTKEDLAALTGGAVPSGGVGLPGALAGIPMPDIADATADLAIHVEQTTTRLSGIDATIHLGDTGDPHLIATFIKWNEPVTVAAPPADQVQTTP